MSKKSLIIPNNFSSLFFNGQQFFKTGGTAMKNEQDIKLYPFREKKRRRAVRVEVIIKLPERRLRKFFTVPNNLENQTCCRMESKNGISYEIPFSTILKIGNLLTKVKDKLKNGESVDSLLKPNPSIEKFVDKHFRDNFEEIQPNEKSRLNKVLEYWGKLMIKDVYSMDIERYKIECLKRRAQSTVRKYCLILRSIFKLSVELGYRDKNPFFNVKLPSNQNETEREPIPIELLPEIFQTMLERDKELFDYCCLIYLTGLRPGDAGALKFDNLKIINGIKTLEVLESKNRNRNRGKTLIPIHPDLDKILLNNRNSGYIVEYKLSRKSIVDAMGRRFGKLFDVNFTPYNFRHTFATQLGIAKVTKLHIDFLMGKLPEGTMKYYLKRDLPTLYTEICLLPGVVKLIKSSENKQNLSRFFLASEIRKNRKENSALKTAEISTA